MPIIVMICFARSGGTILNKCLGSLPNVLMITETSPLISDSNGGDVGIGTIKGQAKKYYQIDLKSNDFGEAALELSQIAAERGCQLVIRDWSYSGFFSFGKKHSTPPNKLVTLEVLEKKCKVVPFCFARDAIDIWISLTKRLPIEMETFFTQYLQYIQAIKARNIAVFKYEDFVRNHQQSIRQICRHTGLEFSDSWKNYISHDKVTGDTQFDPFSRGRKAGIIRPIPRRRLPKKRIAELNLSDSMIRANELLGYPTSYYDVERESMVSAIDESCKRFVHRYIMAILRRLKRWLGG